MLRKALLPLLVCVAGLGPIGLMGAGHADAAQPSSQPSSSEALPEPTPSASSSSSVFAEPAASSSPPSPVLPEPAPSPSPSSAVLPEPASSPSPASPPTEPATVSGASTTASTTAETFTWSGYEWTKRADAGAPTYNGRWSPDNVVLEGPTARLLVTNPTGTSPVAAELRSARSGWGYGTYTIVTRGDFAGMGQSLVFGNLFTYDFTQAPGASANEIDAGEISAWGVPGEPKTVSTSHWLDGGPTNVMGIVKELHVLGPRTMTFQLDWQPGRIAYRVYHGAGTTGKLFDSAVVTRGVPVPAQERVVVNAWVTSANADAEAATRPFAVELLSFDFVPLP